MYGAFLLEAALEKVTQSGVDKSCMQKQHQALQALGAAAA